MARTRLNTWQFSTMEDRAKMNYVQLTKETVYQSSNATQVHKIQFPDGVDGINIKTIRIEAKDRNAFVVRLLDGPTDMPIYESIEEMQFQYDNIDIPYKPADRFMYVEIFNKGGVATKFHIDIRGIEVK